MSGGHTTVQEPDPRTWCPVFLARVYPFFTRGSQSPQHSSKTDRIWLTLRLGTSIQVLCTFGILSKCPSAPVLSLRSLTSSWSSSHHLQAPLGCHSALPAPPHPCSSCLEAPGTAPWAPSMFPQLGAAVIVLVQEGEGAACGRRDAGLSAPLLPLLLPLLQAPISQPAPEACVALLSSWAPRHLCSLIITGEPCSPACHFLRSCLAPFCRPAPQDLSPYTPGVGAESSSGLPKAPASLRV